MRNQLTIGPIAHATVDRGDIAQQFPCTSLALQVHITQEARLLATLAVRHQLVAILRNAIQLPLVDHPRLDAFAQAEKIVGADAVGDPRRVISPGKLHRAVPDAGISSSVRIVVARHHPLPPLAFQGHGRNVAELLCTELDKQQRGARIPQLGVNHLRVRSDEHRVAHQAAVLVRRQASHAYLPATGGRRQVDPAGALVAGGGLAIDSLAQHLLVRAAVGGYVDGIFDPVPSDVAVGVLLLERRPC
ncbi:Uncharacterised protein [Pseudomonas aeruginosa]|nr:Uncharacterised protein [Pseudomonas aeruginosa]